jgi:hypothetical protein
MSSSDEGPVERIPLPSALAARVVDRGPPRRIHGFAVGDDLAPGYSFAEIVLLSLTGRPPTEGEGRAFEVVLAFSSAIDVGEAPAHAAALARLCASATKNVVGVGAMVLAEHVAARLRELAPLWPWLEDRTLELPTLARAPASRELAELRAALPEPWCTHAIFACSPSLEAALVAILYDVGLVRAERMVAALTIAGLATTCAEGFAVKPMNLRGYPMSTPPFHYVEDT